MIKMMPLLLCLSLLLSACAGRGTPTATDIGTSIRDIPDGAIYLELLRSNPNGG